jgi:hypothetical protein
MNHLEDQAVESSPSARLRALDLAATPATFQGFVAALGAAQIGIFACGNLRLALRLVPDDASYYLQIAGNVAAGRGFTFDGINPTNGFQPLWLLILVAVHAVIKGSPETLYRVSLVVDVAVLSLACLLLHRTLRALLAPTRAFVAGIVGAVTLFQWTSRGMESALVVLTLTALCWYGWRARVLTSERAAPLLGFGLLAGLVMLARLDTVFILAPVFALLAGRAVARRDRGSVGRLAWTLAGAAILVVPYLTLNKLFEGGFMPISGQLKSSFPHPDLHHLGSRALALGGPAVGRASLALAYLGWYGLRGRAAGVRGSGGAYLRGSVALLSLGVALHFLHELTFLRWALAGWHFASGAPLLAGVLAAVSSVFPERRPHRLAVPLQWLVLATSLALGVWGLANRVRLRGHEAAEWRVVAYEAAVWIRENTPETAVFAMKDAGTVGYFSRRSVINLDGLVNNLELQRALRDRDLNGYLRRKKVGYLIQHAFLPGDPFLRWSADGDLLGRRYETARLQYYSQKYRVYGDALTLHRDRERYRSDAFASDGVSTRLVLWSLDAP